MSITTVRAVLAAAIATSGTLTLSYPSGTSRGNFFNGSRHRMVWGGTIYEAPKDFTMTFNANASGITFTWLGSTTIPIGAELVFNLDRFGSNFPDSTFDLDMASIPRVSRSRLVWVDLGTPAASSATALRAAASVSGAGSLTLLTAGMTFDMGRNVIITSAGNDSGITFAVVGTDEYGVAVAETITGANAGVAAGLKAFKTITTITASGASAGNVSIGFGNVLGLPVFLRDAVRIIKETLNAASATAGTTVAGVTSTPTATTGDVRGTYVPNSAPDGTRAYALLLALDSPAYRGAPQFAG